jgi:hypothetical protein
MIQISVCFLMKMTGSKRVRAETAWMATGVLRPGAGPEHDTRSITWGVWAR